MKSAAGLYLVVFEPPQKMTKKNKLHKRQNHKSNSCLVCCFSIVHVFTLLLSTHAFSRGMSHDLAYLAWKSMFRLFTPLPVFAALDTGPVCKPLDFNFVQPTMKKTTSNKPTNRSQAYTLLENNCYIYGEL